MARRLLLLLSCLAFFGGLTGVAVTLRGLLQDPARVPASASPTPSTTAESDPTGVTSPPQSSPGAVSGSLPLSEPSPQEPLNGVVAGASAAVAAAVLDRVNLERGATGAGGLRNDPTLQRFAQEWADRMPASGYRHSDRERLRAIIDAAGAGAVSENLHAPEPQCPAGTGCAERSLLPTSGVVVVDWLRSDTHRTSMLDPSYEGAGVGVRCDADGRLWVVMLFATPSGVRVDPDRRSAAVAPAGEGNGGMTCAGSSRPHSVQWRHP